MIADAGSCSSRIILNAQARSVGGEIELFARPNEHWDFGLSATYANSEITKSQTDTVGNPIAGIRDGNRLPTAPKFQAAAFAGGLAAVALVWLAARWLPAVDRTLTLILAGVAVGSLLAAGVALLKYLADPYGQLPAITFWLLGSFASIGQADLAGLALCAIAGLIPLLLMRWRADALMLSDDEVRALGVGLPLLRLSLVVGATLLTAATVAAAGIIGWIGLVVPHAARLLVGASFPRLLPVAMLLGALLMLAIDTVGRSIGQAELPPGVLTALIGAPVLFFLMLRRRDD